MRLPPVGPVWAAHRDGVRRQCAAIFLITWGQQAIDSALAGILIAAMPLATLVLAHFIVVGERLTQRRAAGLLAGFAGILVLMGPAVAAGAARSALQVVSELAVLGGALCYSANSILARLLVKTDFLVDRDRHAARGEHHGRSIAITLEQPWTLAPSFASTAAIVWLGIGPTALATILTSDLISSAGPTFMSLVNYLSPAVAVFLGVMLMGEQPGVNAYAGLC